LRKDHWMDTDRSVEYMRPQIELAGRLGFPVVRTQLGLTPEVLEKVEPIAAKVGVKLGMEVHAPEGPNTPKVMATREAYAGIDSLQRAWAAPGAPFQRYGQFAAECAQLGEPELPVGFARLVFTMFGRENLEDWREVLPQVVHIHGKFYDVDVDDDLVSPS